MNWKPMPEYFFIRIPKKDQIERREKIGSIFFSPSHIFMTREVQHGEIIEIGEDAHNIFPEANIGDTLITHHFVSGDILDGNDKGEHLIHSDEKYNYYTVTCFSHNGRRNETYGVWNGKEIIPHPEFIFLEGDRAKETVSVDKFIETKFEQKGTLLVAKDWTESREEKGKRMADLKYEAQELARTVRKDEFGREYMPDEVKIAIEEKEREMNAISRIVNKKEFIPLKVEWSSSTLADQLGEEVKNGDLVYVLNQAAQTKIEFNGISYAVANIKYICATNRWIGESLKKYKRLKKELA